MRETDEQWAERMARNLLGVPDEQIKMGILRELHDEMKRDKVQPSARLALLCHLHDEWQELLFFLNQNNHPGVFGNE